MLFLLHYIKFKFELQIETASVFLFCKRKYTALSGVAGYEFFMYPVKNA